MTLDDARGIVRDCVAQNGPERAKRLLSERCETDDEFNLAVVRHGATIMEALIESMGATRH